MNYAIVLEEKNSFDKKTVIVFMEQDGEHRKVERTHVPEKADVARYVDNHLAALWADGQPLESDQWEAANERAFSNLYQAVARAGARAARGRDKSLIDVIQAMEAVIDESGKASAYARYQSLASSATAAQRDHFFLIVGFLVMGQLHGS